MSFFSFKKKEKKADPAFFSEENLKSLGILIIAILAIRWSIASPYHVPTASMEPTIKVGDRLLGWKLPYGFKIPFTDRYLIEWASIKRGDIIVFRYPKDPNIDYVKRVIGLPGDKIQIISNELYVNGVKQEKSPHDFDRSILKDIEDDPEIQSLFRENLDGVDHWLMEKIPSSRRYQPDSWPSDSTYYTVPEKSVFAMGDNRFNSADSRIWGKVPMENIRGKAVLVLWSMHWKGDSWVPSFRWSRFGQILDKYTPPAA